MGLEEDTWHEYSKHVLAELHRLNENFEVLNAKIDKNKEDQALQFVQLKDEHISPLRTEVAVVKTELRVKSSIWGLLGGIIPTAILLIVYFLQEAMK